MGSVLLHPISSVVLSAVQRMALAHLASMDMSSVDKDEPSSGEEDGEREEESELTASAAGWLSANERPPPHGPTSTSLTLLNWISWQSQKTNRLLHRTV